MLELSGIIAIVYIVYQIYAARRQKTPQMKIEAFEASAQKFSNYALQDILRNGREQIKYVLDATERDYLHLKERYRHDEKRRLELATDWYEYTEAIFDLSSAADMLDVNASFDYDEDVKASHVKRHQIERRLQQMLGSEPADRWNDWYERNRARFEIAPRTTL